MLELFSGTGSVGDVARSRGWEVVSLDRDMPADIQQDILDWDYSQWQPSSFHFIWASPPCTEYSIAKTLGVRDIEGSNKVVQRTLDIIQHLKPQFYCVENPQTGKLKEQSFMHALPYQDIDYCKYGMPYRKRTRLWNDIYHWCPRPLCKKDCNAMDEEGKRHQQAAQRCPNPKDPNKHNKRHWSSHELYRIPFALVDELLFAVETGFGDDYDWTRL